MYNVNITRPGVRASDFSTTQALYYMRAERPKVIYNANTSQYVMWGYADNYNRSLRMSVIATSCWPNGPFTFNKVLLPDRNESTTDLTLFQNENGTAFLARTYYINQTYSMPRPIMQPTWESVKEAGSTHAAPIIDYAMNYHRAFYDTGYDNIKDIYTQEWRLENLPWRVIIGDYVETYDVATGMYKLSRFPDPTNENIVVVVVPAYAGADREKILAEYTNQNEPRVLLGQVRKGCRGVSSRDLRFDYRRAFKLTDRILLANCQGQPPILSRYKDPSDPTTSPFQPSSVLSVKTQTWGQNYHDNNIADNPVIPTVADLLIGPDR